MSQNPTHSSFNEFFLRSYYSILPIFYFIRTYFFIMVLCVKISDSIGCFDDVGFLYLVFKVISTNDYNPDCQSLFIYLFNSWPYCHSFTNLGIDDMHHHAWSLKHLYPCRVESRRPLHTPLLIQFLPPRREPGGFCSLRSSQFLGNQGVSSVFSARICPVHKGPLVPTGLAGPSWGS